MYVVKYWSLICGLEDERIEKILNNFVQHHFLLLLLEGAVPPKVVTFEKKKETESLINMFNYIKCAK